MAMDNTQLGTRGRRQLDATGNADDSRPIERLSKPEVQHIHRTMAKFDHYHDEKRHIYQQHHDQMNTVFDQARAARADLSSEYEARNKFILDRLEDMKILAETETQKDLDRLKEFSGELESTLLAQKRAFRAQLKDISRAMNNRRAAAADDQAKMGAMIQEEHEECKKHTASEVDPITERLQEHWKFLNAEIEERQLNEKEYHDVMAGKFKKLRRLISNESQARKAQCSSKHAEAERRYQELEKEHLLLEGSGQDNMDKLQTKLETEKVDSTRSNAMVTHEMAQFMAHFESSIAETRAKQDSTRAHLHTLREQLRSG